MKDQKLISRSSLYDLQSEYESDSSEYIAPKIDLEFIEVESPHTNNDDDEEEKQVVQDDEDEPNNEEFEFPLFASAMTVEDPSSPDTKLEERGRTKQVEIMKVSLREQSEERIDNERPESYYFAKYTKTEKKQFEQCCVTYNDIFSQLYIVDSQPWKCLDLNKYNAKVEIELNREKERKKKNRPGKKKRDVRVACRQRKLERVKLKKLEEEEKKKQLKKQKYQKKSFGKYNNTKRKPNTVGGVKKRQQQQQQQQSKPKYRTE